MIDSSSVAEPTGDEQISSQDSSRAEVFRKTERAKMARTLDRMLGIAGAEARRRSTPNQVRLGWVNAVAYLSQTYNALLRDTEVNELKEQLTMLQEKLEKIARSGHQ